METIRIEQGTLKNEKWIESDEGNFLAVFQGNKRLQVFHIEDRGEMFHLIRTLLPVPVVLEDDEFFEQVRQTDWKESLIAEFGESRDQGIAMWEKDNDKEMVAFQHEEYERYIAFLDLLFSEIAIDEVVSAYNKLDTAQSETIIYMLKERYKKSQ